MSVDEVQRIRHPMHLGFLLVVFVLNIADDFFQNILHADHTRGAAVLVHNDRHLCLLAGHFRKHVIALRRFRHEKSLPHEISHAVSGNILPPDQPQQVFRVQHSNDIVDVVLIHRHAGIFLVLCQLHHIGNRHFHVNGNQFLPVRHDIRNGNIVKFKDIVDHFPLLLLDHAVFVAGVDQMQNIFFCHAFLCRTFSAGKAVHTLIDTVDRQRQHCHQLHQSQ